MLNTVTSTLPASESLFTRITRVVNSVYASLDYFAPVACRGVVTVPLGRDRGRPRTLAV